MQTNITTKCVPSYSPGYRRFKLRIAGILECKRLARRPRNEITTQCRGYRSTAARKLAIHGLRRRGFNYFVCFRDVQSDFALQYGNADWVKPGDVYVNW